MKKSDLFTIIKKEFARFFGDKRMVMTAFLPGILIYVMYTAMGSAFSEMGSVEEAYVYDVHVVEMSQTIAGLKEVPSILFNDAVTIPGVQIEQIPIIKGDAKSVSIAAASVLAKVTRDHMMVEYDQLFPDYGFAKHKGYGTAAHIAAIREFGPTPIHRRTFIKNFLPKE